MPGSNFFAILGPWRFRRRKQPLLGLTTASFLTSGCSCRFLLPRLPNLLPVVLVSLTSTSSQARTQAYLHPGAVSRAFVAAFTTSGLAWLTLALLSGCSSSLPPRTTPASVHHTAQLPGSWTRSLPRPLAAWLPSPPHFGCICWCLILIL